MLGAASGLSRRQQELLHRWLPDAEVIADLSWGLVATTVWEVVSDQGRFIVKAGGAHDHHIARELRAHRTWLTPWVSTGHAAQLAWGDNSAKLLVSRYLPGELVEGAAAQSDPDTYRQAGELLARFHAQWTGVDPHWNDTLRGRVLGQLGRPHRLERRVEDRSARRCPGGRPAAPTLW